MKYKPIILIMIFFLPIRLSAEEKKSIQVQFSITEPQYRSFYGPEINQIEHECSSLIVDFLNQKFSFFQFKTGAAETKLNIELADAEQNSVTHSALKEVGFKLTIQPHVKPGAVETTYWVFRPVERYTEGLPDVRSEFVGEIAQTFKLGTQNSKEDLMKNIFSQVEVADDFYFIQARKLFILPLSKKETNIAEFSRFQIVIEVSDILGTIELYDTTRVLTAIENKEAIQHYHLPASYAVGSLVLTKLKENAPGISGTDTIAKKIFILKQIPLPDSELEMIGPENVLSDSNSN